MATKYFSQSLNYDIRKYKEEKEFIFSILFRLTGKKTWGLTHIWEGGKDLKNGQKQFLSICKDSGLSNLYYKKSYLRK